MWREGSRLGLLACGSFNPPTLMHLRMMETAKEELEQRFKCQVVEGIISPVADSFGKPGLLSATHRFAMASAAVQTSKWIRADNWECSKSTWTRTLVALMHHRDQLRSRYGDDTGLALVVGGDVVESFTRVLPDGSNLWNPEDVKTIVTEFGLVVISRSGSSPIEVLENMSLPEALVEVVRDEACPCDISSTRLRAAVAAGRSIQYCTPDDVIAYINRHSLYS